MFDGLAMMNEAELVEVARLLGVEKPPASREVLHEIASVWMTKAVKGEGRPREEVERAILQATAETFKIPVAANLDTNNLEREIRRHFAAESVEYLDSSWTIICALVAVGKADNISRKLTLLEQAAALPVPSRALMRERRVAWERLCARWAGTDPMPELQPHISNVMNRSERGVECLTLGLALSLLDGSVSFPTERLFRDLADEFGLDRGQADNLQKRVTNLYWKHHNASQPASAQGGLYDPVVDAARLTVYEAGALEALATDARNHLFTRLEPEGKKSGWSRIASVFSDKKADKTTLSRVAYHAIVKQHVAISAAQVEQEIIAAEQAARSQRAAPPKPDPFTAPAAPPAASPTQVPVFQPPAGATSVPMTVPEPDFPAAPPPPPPLAEKVHQPVVKRSIKLDP